MKKLKLNQMERIEGGVDVQTYCATINRLYLKNYLTWSFEVQEMYFEMYAKHCYELT